MKTADNFIKVTNPLQDAVSRGFAEGVDARPYNIEYQSANYRLITEFAHKTREGVVNGQLN